MPPCTAGVQGAGMGARRYAAPVLFDPGTVPQLMCDQLEFADVLVVNKADLVSEAQLGSVEALGHAFELGTYALFAVLCGAASYIAVPAVQRIAIPEASPTLPLAASLGLTFTWNVTIGIPIYIEIARQIVTAVPVAG